MGIMRPFTALSAVTALMGSVLTLAGPASAAGPGHTVLPSPVPAATSPGFGNGKVATIVQVGSTVVAGGTFSTVTPPGGAQRSVTGVAAFSASTGQLVSGFAPELNGDVEHVQAGPLPGTVYLAGSFTRVDGVAQSHVTLLEIATGEIVDGFRPAATNGRVNALTMARGRLVLGGNFTTAGGQAHRGLATLNATTGALDPLMDVQVTGHHNDRGSGAQGAVGVRQLEATSDGERIAVVGNFKQVDGLARDQLVVLDVSPTDASVDPDWRTRRYEPYCFYWAFDSYMRGVAVSPDDSYFVVTTTGGGNPGTLCDAAARFEFDASGQDIQPTWVANSGGDTLWGVDVTENAVYVGGHQRWMNNADGRDSNGQGSVPRPGLAALDPDSGVPLSWNPGRNPRGTAAFAIHATTAGVWVGSDTVWIGNRQWRRNRLAFFPLAGGSAPASESVPTLPADVHLGGGRVSGLATVEFDGSTPGARTSVDVRDIDWNTVRGAFVVGDTLFYARTDGYLYRRVFTADETGPAERIDPYNDPFWSDVDTGSNNTYRGRVPALYGQLSSLTGIFYDADRIYYTRTNDSQLYWRWFNADSGIVGSQQFTASGGRSWSDTGGLFLDGNQLYVVSRSTGRLSSLPFDGGPQGAPTLVDSSTDWRANAVFIGPSADAPPANEPPTAAFTVDCEHLACSLDASGSTDPEDALAGYAWDFGDGKQGTGRTTNHTYAAGGSYTVTLEVTDAAGATATTTRTVSVSDPPPTSSDIAFRASASAAGNNVNPSVAIPGGVRAGDLLVLVGGYQSGGAVSDPAGWTRVDAATTQGLDSVVWTRTATASDAGSRVVTPLASRLKFSLTLGAYTGTAPDAVAAIASAADATTNAHRSPTVQAPAGAWVVSAWTEKSSSTTAWTAPAGMTAREQAVGAGGGRIAALCADSAGPVASGTQGGQVATTDGSGRGIAWTMALRPAP
jgi:PKD repeat protein